MSIAQIKNINDYNKSVSDSITAFLESVSVESLHTRTTYETAIRGFFKETRNKDLQFLVESDLDFTLLEVEKYRNSLVGKFKNSTINLKMIAVKKLFDKLKKYGYDVDISVFEIKRLKQHDSSSYQSLSALEIQKVINTLRTTQNALEKLLLVKLAFATAMRKKTLLDLKFSDIYTRDDMYLVKALGKGNKWSIKRIDEDLYNAIQEHKNMVNRDKVFSLSSSAVQRMMDYINEQIDFGDRRITFHSFKKASIEEVGVLTGYDIKAMQKQGDHADVTTTLNVYVREKELEDMVVVTDNVQPVDLSILKTLTNDQLCDIIKTLDRETQIKIVNMAKRS